MTEGDTDLCRSLIPRCRQPLSVQSEASSVNGTGDGSGEGASANLNSSVATEHDPHFEPIVSLPEVVVPTLEEEEEEMIKLRAKLFRFDSSETPSEWKDRGTGDVKLLRHPSKNTVRVVMRRDKTLKICANHFVTPYMELQPNCGSDRAWVWSTKADYADETPKPELLAIRFANAENAQRWKEKFEEAKVLAATYAPNDSKDEEDEDEQTDSDEDDLNKTEDFNEPAATEPDEKSAAEVTEQLEKLNVSGKDDPDQSPSDAPKE